MVSVKLLIISVATLFCYILSGFVLRKLKLVSGEFSKSMSLLTMYLTQIALYLQSYMLPFDKIQFKNLVCVGLASFVIHGCFYLIASLMFRKFPDKTRKLVTFSVIFSNAGFMGLPLIEDILGPSYTIYATIYLFAFNVFSFTVGRLIFTDDKSYISVKKIFLNPAVIPISTGIILYVTGAGGWIYNMATSGDGSVLSDTLSVIYKVLTMLKSMVAPATMLMIGVRLAETKFRDIFKDKYFYVTLAVRQFMFPFLVWSVCRLLLAFGIISTDVITVLVILSSTPIAAAASIFSELYNGDKQRAGGFVAMSTLCSIVTMPLVALLLYI